MCCLVVLPLLYEANRVDRVLGVVEDVSNHDIEAAALLKEIAVLQSDLRSQRESAVAEAVIARAENRLPDVILLQQGYIAESEKVNGLVDRLHTLAVTSAGAPISSARERLWKEMIDRSSRLRDAFQRVQKDAIPMFDKLLQGRVDDARAVQPQLTAMRAVIDTNITDGSQISEGLAQAGQDRIRQLRRELIESAVIAGIVAIVVAIAIAFLTSRSITARLRRAVRLTGQVRDGDLTQQVAAEGSDELATLGRYLNDMAAKLRTVASSTRATAESMHAATAQIRASTQQQAASVAQQLAAVEETTATLSEITESGAQINRRAQGVAENAQAAAATSETGLKAVEDTNQAMDAIREQAEAVAENIVLLSERTQAIGEIILTVNDIAERSHLLALNAAIEAAAAGEHGRTFAVVASEIKSLADQAKEATAQVRSNLSEIQHGINASVMLTEEAVKRVGAGKRQTDATQATIRDLAESVQESLLAFQQIVAGTNQQQIGLEQVTRAMQNIRDAGTQTAAGTRQLEGAAANLNDLGEGLVGLVQYYRV
ncbi:methyl-accepting chemotaxis protein [Azospirillum rugosum]|uniref:Methyl-accepting chemotaxis protein n=1 Tax=Azospirillum rugosum TaxID=416170 RepID=A0ABS4SJI2_9PROT|nr:methyl-accepting chemotaxis protein [Azospirillum rugosum]MBP2292662.1 methyl-accepting chemotaxis protein [Azospirillum rugosum]MDQ0526314.1 methyl-accepting chemotaxis protein [Azospirillum rugosum]